MTTSNPAGGLLDLIERKRNGRTNPEMARDSGGLLQATHFSNLKSKGVRGFPHPETIRGYAQALDVSVTDIVLAVAVSKGLDPGELGVGDANQLVIDGAGRLPSESRALLRDTAAQLLWWQKQVESGPARSEDLPAVFDLAANDQPEPTAEERERAKLDDLGEENQAGPDDDHEA